MEDTILHNHEKGYFKGIQIIVWIALLSSYPYIFSLILPIPSFGVMQVLVLLCLIGWSLYKKPVLMNLPKNITNIFIIQGLIWLIYVFIHRDTSYFTRIVYVFATYCCLVGLYNYPNGILIFFRRYNKWIMVMAIGGIIAFFLVLLADMQPLFEFIEQDDRPGYFFGMTATNTWIGNIIRYAGYFDEPGQMAFWGIWALLFNHLFIHNRLVEKLLLICLIFTLSLAYYIQALMYLLFFKIKKLKSAISLSFILAFIIGIAFYLKDSNPFLYEFTFARLEHDDMGQLKGDNRSNLAENAKAVFIEHPIVGVGARFAQDHLEYMGDNPYTLLAYDGIIGTINSYLPLLFILILNYKRIEFFKVCAIIIVGYIQRPYSVYFISPFILYSFLTLSYFKYNAKNFGYNSLLQRC